jgi:uracil-DNA glycosylase family 4
VALHKDRDKFPLLYRFLWRLRREPYLLRDTLDADFARALALKKSVERDVHKMHAFVRFREVVGAPDGRRIAWFEPEHYILETAAPFFMRRFANFPWSILTPEQSAHWDTSVLSFGPGGRRSDAPAEDAHEDLWRTYYASIFNPARLKPAATYVTNAVKHFKFEPRGKRRIHKKPSELEVTACGQWLRRELQLIEPTIVVALGATAARALFGRAVAIGEDRGRILSGHAPGAPDVLVTVHPSYLLRVPPEKRAAEYARFVADLRLLSPTTPAHASADDRR